MRLFNAFLELLYPPRCIICDEPILDFGYCDSCTGKLKPISAPLCQYCGLEKDLCSCKYFLYHFDAITAPYYNEGYAKQGIYDLKFNSKFNCLKSFGKEMAKCVIRDFGLENIDLICCMPPKNRSMYDRGFNQAEFLADEVAAHLKIKLSKNLIKYIHEGKTQHRLKTIEDRFDNVRGNFKVTKRIDGKNVLLIDDIKTTGASIDECSRQLKFAGANKVYCVTALVTKAHADQIIDL